MLKNLLIFILFTLSNSMFIKVPTNIVNIKRRRNDQLLIQNKCDILEKILGSEFTQANSKIIVQSLSNTLPQFDSISHIVLNTNSKLISYVLNDEFIPPQIKKDIILLTIKMTQEGDNMGGQILELYYNIVNYIL
jgi:hypothetical protein